MGRKLEKKERGRMRLERRYVLKVVKLQIHILGVSDMSSTIIW
jgi:hypothetical protein